MPATCLTEYLPVSSTAHMIFTSSFFGIQEDDFVKLFQVSIQFGAILADASIEDAQKLYDFGVNIGIGFQLKDDLLDVYADKDKFGKQVGGDIIENKKTWLMLRAQQLAKGTPEEEELAYWLTQTAPSKSAQKVEAVTQLYTRLGIKELALAKVATYFDYAFQLIEQLPVDENRKKPLKDLATLLLQRES